MGGPLLLPPIMALIHKGNSTASVFDPLHRHLLYVLDLVFPPGTLQAFYKLFSELLLNVRITCITCKTARLHLEQSEDKVYGDSFSNYSAISFLKKIARTLKLFAPLSRNVFLHPRACAKNFKLPPVPLYFIFALIGVAPLSS